METILVIRGEGRCLLGSTVDKRLQVLHVGPELTEGKVGGVARTFFCERWHSGYSRSFPQG